MSPRTGNRKTELGSIRFVGGAAALFLSLNTNKGASSFFEDQQGLKNGNKVFQPFFTTKPTGQRIWLGLSLSYDIIKAHGGTLKVESKEDEGSEFVIELPIV